MQKPHDDLPREADNYDVFCERCQRVHRHFTFTQEHYDGYIDRMAKQLADEIDRRTAQQIYEEFYADHRKVL